MKKPLYIDPTDFYQETPFNEEVGRHVSDATHVSTARKDLISTVTDKEEGEVVEAVNWESWGNGYSRREFITKAWTGALWLVLVPSFLSAQNLWWASMHFLSRYAQEIMESSSRKLTTEEKEAIEKRFGERLDELTDTWIDPVSARVMIINETIQKDPLTEGDIYLASKIMMRLFVYGSPTQEVNDEARQQGILAASKIAFAVDTHDKKYGTNLSKLIPIANFIAHISHLRWWNTPKKYNANPADLAEFWSSLEALSNRFPEHVLIEMLITNKFLESFQDFSPALWAFIAQKVIEWNIPTIDDLATYAKEDPSKQVYLWLGYEKLYEIVTHPSSTQEEIEGGLNAIFETQSPQKIADIINWWKLHPYAQKMLWIFMHTVWWAAQPLLTKLHTPDIQEEIIHTIRQTINTWDSDPMIALLTKLKTTTADGQEINITQQQLLFAASAYILKDIDFFFKNIEDRNHYLYRAMQNVNAEKEKAEKKEE